MKSYIRHSNSKSWFAANIRALPTDLNALYWGDYINTRSHLGTKSWRGCAKQYTLIFLNKINGYFFKYKDWTFLYQFDNIFIDKQGTISISLIKVAERNSYTLILKSFKITRYTPFLDALIYSVNSSSRSLKIIELGPATFIH